MNLSGLTYIVFLFCTGSMTGSLCPYTDANLMIPLEVQMLLPNEPLVNGEIYGFKSWDSNFQFIAHRKIGCDDGCTYGKPFGVDGEMFKGDSNGFAEAVPRDYVVWKYLNRDDVKI